ncbi:VCBS repeat-containing protein [Flavobacteriaceae bacterium GF1]
MKSPKVNIGFVLMVISSLVLITSCQKNKGGPIGSKEPSLDNRAKQFFKKRDAQATNINFSNRIRETPNFNYFLYPFIYFGGGVATGDINNDGLPDIYFTGNMGLNSLYLNQGDLKFKDISKRAGVQGVYNRWTTGVTMADVNNDGFLDVYVSVAGPNDTRDNLLYINQKDNTFKEKAKEYGLNDNGHTIQSVFFDFDNDGDLDVYVGNYPPSGFNENTEFFVSRTTKPLLIDSDRLYRNDNGRFVDVTRKSGILNYGLTLGLSTADFNNDGLMDIYVSNDFNSPDYLYINQGDGTFQNKIMEYTEHTSNFGMGTDAADINNDGLIDLLQLDMMGRTNEQQKANMSAMDTEAFYHLVDQGLHHQYMKNTLQLNTGIGRFSEVGELAGIAYTDWSWGALFFDMDNDGLKDIFITNGMRRNVNDNDFNAYYRILQAYDQISPEDYISLLKKMPVQPVANFAFLNNGDLTFSERDTDYGLAFEGFSHGAAYADLDLDGDLDLVVNNLDRPAHIYENVRPNETSFNSLRIRLEGRNDNHFGIGSKVSIYTDKTIQSQELFLSRGYESSVEPILHFGLGEYNRVDSVKIRWPNGHIQTVRDLNANQVVHIQQSINQNNGEPLSAQSPLFNTWEPVVYPSYKHQENDYNDFDGEVLLPHKMSQFGPALAVGDVNNDGLDDFYVGGAKGHSGVLYLQKDDGSFKSVSNGIWLKDRSHEDVSAVFFDADSDGLLDLYVVSGGNEMPEGHEAYGDRLYLNLGNGKFQKTRGALPKLFSSGSCVKIADFDKDGDPDLFVGGRQTPGQYPNPTNSYLLRNNSTTDSIVFEDVTKKVAPQFENIGMVTDVEWADVNNDTWPDLVVVGEWMAPKVFHNLKGNFQEVSEAYGLNDHVGWWNSVKCQDLDGDGDMDIVAGNLGLNYKYKASKEEPFKIYAADFDGNGSQDIVLGYYNDGELFPLRGRECSSQQIPSIKKKFKNYTEFSKARLVDVYPETQLDDAIMYEATFFANTVFINDNKTFKSRPLPNEAQVSSVNAIHLFDYDNDGNPDILMAGNLYGSEVETPRNDAGIGWLLKGDGKGNFKAIPPNESGVFINGEVKGIIPLKKSEGRYAFLIARNGMELQILSPTNG